MVAFFDIYVVQNEGRRVRMRWNNDRGRQQVNSVCVQCMDETEYDDPKERKGYKR